ncbi:MAG: NADH-quinone oxidoreductase subunit L, partial [Candidatus Nealsonbacteria bacterium]|nr:NADH-quinone oxidoreductase subunit L [Candidatus Nealsonbacteria bacterium]
HACHTNEMPEMGGLRKKMPWTAGTMLIGCLTISGAGIPLLIGLSGYYSKDYIIAQALSFKAINPQHAWLYYAAVVGAAITACYMFRLWYMTFAGQPRDKHVYEHAHESPREMTGPLVVLAVFAVIVGWNLPFTDLGLEPLLEQARPEVTVHPAAGVLTKVNYPAEHVGHTDHAIHVNAGLIAFAMAAVGFLLATVFYGLRKLDPEDTRKQFAPLHRFLVNKWWFDELYRFVFVRPVLTVSGWISTVDKRGIDWVADGSAKVVTMVSRVDDWIDRTFVDGLIERIATSTYAVGMKLRFVQTGNLRQYVVWIAVGTVGLFVLVSVYWNYTL